MIRKATLKDIDSVSEIYENIHAEERQGRIRTGWIDGIYPVRTTAEKAYEKGELFVYEDSGSVLAAAVINQQQVDVYVDGDWSCEASDNEVMVLHTLVVEPSVKSKGIGKEFVRFYEDYACSMGCKALRMDTNEKNTAARGLYKKLGYREVGIVPCTFSGIPNVQLVLLEKVID